VSIVFGSSLLAGDDNSFMVSGVQSFTMSKRYDAALGRLVVGDVSIAGAAGSTLALQPAMGRDAAVLATQALSLSNTGDIVIDARLSARSRWRARTASVTPSRPRPVAR
jgi:hypothetical protein